MSKTKAAICRDGDGNLRCFQRAATETRGVVEDN
jgi:hypothetical protein